MKCKVGDVAMFKGDATCPNNGKYVTCLEYIGLKRTLVNATLQPELLHVWRVSDGLTDVYSKPTNLAGDEYLYPIPPGLVSDKEVRDLYAAPPKKQYPVIVRK